MTATQSKPVSIETKIEYKKIITHGGNHHGDEILAIATVQYFLGESLPIERKFNVTPEELNDPEIIILDLGRQCDPLLSNFDHHQDKDLPATNMLVLSWFCRERDLREKLEKHLFNKVSDIDRGIIEGGGNSDSFNAIIRNMNNCDANKEMAFVKAVNLASVILYSYIETARMAIEGEARWDDLLVIHNKIKIQLDSKVIPDWKELAQRDEIYFLITPNVRGGFNLISRNSIELPIPAMENIGQTYCHTSNFMAVYDSIENAQIHAAQLVNEYELMNAVSVIDGTIDSLNN